MRNKIIVCALLALLSFGAGYVTNKLQWRDWCEGGIGSCPHNSKMWHQQSNTPYDKIVMMQCGGCGKTKFREKIVITF